MANLLESQIAQVQKERIEGLIRYAVVEGAGLTAVVGLWYFAGLTMTFLVGGILSVIALCVWFFLRPVLQHHKDIQKLKGLRKW